MKKNVLPLLAFILLAGISCQETVDIEKEKEAIKTVIKEETAAFCARDFDRMAATYVQDETNTRMGASKSGYAYYSGWEEIGSGFKEFFENNPDTCAGKYEKSNFVIKVYNKSAWSINDETVYDSEGQVTWTNKSLKILEKVDGEWKIVHMSIINTSSYEEEPEEEAGEGEEEVAEEEETETEDTE